MGGALIFHNYMYMYMYVSKVAIIVLHTCIRPLHHAQNFQLLTLVQYIHVVWHKG